MRWRHSFLYYPRRSGGAYMNTTTIDKSAIVASARARFTVRFPDRSPVGRCVHLSGCMIEELAERGIKGVFQAGSCYWPRLTPEQFKAAPEDVAPWFGYQWEPKSPHGRPVHALGKGHRFGSGREHRCPTEAVGTPGFVHGRHHPRLLGRVEHDDGGTVIGVVVLDGPVLEGSAVTSARLTHRRPPSAPASGHVSAAPAPNSSCVARRMTGFWI
jgi:hypothetical protein